MSKSSDLGLGSDKKLKRELSRWELMFMSFGSIIGSGWLLSPLYAGAIGGASILDWVIGGFLVILIALPYMELGSTIPKSGALVRYPHYSHGGFAGFITSWVYSIPVISSPAIEASASVGYLSSLFPELYSNSSLSPLGIVTSVLLMVFYFFLNYFGVKLLGRVNSGVGWWKLAVPFITASLLLIFDFHPANFSLGGFISPFDGFKGIPALLYSIPVTGIIYSYGGFRQAVEYAGETGNPRNVPFALLTSILLSMGLYILLQVSFIGAVQWDQIGVTPGNWTAVSSSVLTNGPFYEEVKLTPAVGLLSLVLLAWGTILLVDSVVSPSGSGWIYVGTSARLLYGMSADGYLPSFLLKVNRRGIPIFSLVLSLAIGSLFLLPFPSWIALIGFLSAIGVFNYLTSGIVLESLRRNASDIRRNYVLPFAKVFAPLATVSAGLIIYWSGFAYIYYLVVAALLGLPIFFAYYSLKSLNLSKRYSVTLGVADIIGVIIPSILFYEETGGLSSPNNLWFMISVTIYALVVLSNVSVLLRVGDQFTKVEIKAGSWIFVYLLLLYVTSYFGGFGLMVLIPFPWDVVVTVLEGIAIHYLAVKSSVRTKAIDDIKESLTA